MSRSAGIHRAVWLLVRLRLARLTNQVASGMRRFRRAGADERRTATPGKSRLSWFLASLVAVAMLLSFTNLAHQALSHMQQRLGFTTAPPSRLEPVAQGWLGAQVANLTAAEAERSGFAQPQGAKVVASIPGGPAALAGVERGDILISIDRRPIANAADVTRLAGAKGPGSVAELRLLREGREQLIRVTLSARPPPTFQARRGRAPAAPGHALSEGVLQACALEALVLTLAALLMSLTGREFSAPDWDLEWLVTLPVPLATLLCVRILERTIVNPTGLVALWPFLSLVSWECGYRSAAPLIGLAATVPLLLIIAAFWTVIDASLRLRVRPSRLRNLQAVVSVAAVASIYFAMSAGLSANSYVLNWAPLLPKWLFLLPPGLAVDMLTSSAPAAIATSLVLLILEALVCAGLVFALLNRQLRFGVVGTSGRESERGISPAATGGRRGNRILLSPIQAREIALLRRDRNFLVQTLVLPIVIMGGQVLFNAPGSAFAFALSSPQHVAAVAFGVATYALMFSAFQTLNAEGQALWILYSVPHSLQSLLREKALLWGCVCLTYAVAILGFSFAFHATFSAQQLELVVVVLFGVPIFATIGVSLGVFACDPLAQEVQRRVRPSYLYLYMLFASLYGYAIYASDVWQRMALVVLTALLALALWQKARDHLPYLLDPSASPPARVAVADGLMAALLFFVLQGLAAWALTLRGQALTGRVVLMAFTLAGAATYGLMRFAYWRLGTVGVPSTFGPRSGGPLALGAIGGSLAAIAAIIYLRLAAHTSLFADVRQTLFSGRDSLLFLSLLAVVAAPIFEEFIFRGLIFGGLRRSLPLSHSIIASAGIFALVHPPPAVIPVFGLGVAAAFVYEKTGVLLAPIIVHAVYNAAVIAYQALAGT